MAFLLKRLGSKPPRDRSEFGAWATRAQQLCTSMPLPRREALADTGTLARMLTQSPVVAADAAPALARKLLGLDVR